MKIANWYENCKLIWGLQSNSHVFGVLFLCGSLQFSYETRQDWKLVLEQKKMFWFDCGVDDKNSTKPSLPKPSTIHILIPIPMLAQSNSYFKPWFLCSLSRLYNISLNLNEHLKYHTQWVSAGIISHLFFKCHTWHVWHVKYHTYNSIFPRIGCWQYGDFLNITLDFSELL